MTENELKQYWGSNIELHTKTGNIYKGIAGYFADSYDNEPEEASITFEMPYGNVEIYLSEIASIEVIK